jgi:transcriptional regulator of acetoin/glycerol metabolism
MQISENGRSGEVDRPFMFKADAGPDARGLIASSWHRSATCGLQRDDDGALPHNGRLGSGKRLLEASGPVVSRLEELIDASGACVILADERGWIRERRGGDAALSTRLDRAQLAPGYCWCEEYAGTNPVGLAHETRQPSWVCGPDHYRISLCDLAGAAAPIIHTGTGRLTGVIALVAGLEDASRHMLTIVVQAAEAIERRLAAGVSSHDQALLDRFLENTARSGRAVVVLGPRLELCTPSAARMLDGGDRVLLWERATELVSRHPTAAGIIELGDGTTVSAFVQRIEDEGVPVGVTVELDILGSSSRREQRRLSGAEQRAAAFCGRSSSSQHLREQATELADESMPLMIVGEVGVGKVTLAETIASRYKKTILDGARLGDGKRLRKEISTALETPGIALIVRRVQFLSDDGMSWLADVAASAESDGSRVIVTRTVAANGAGPGSTRPNAGFAVQIVVPPLRERLDDMLDLVPHLISRHGGAGRMLPAALQALTRHDWPENTRELDALVRRLLASRRTADIGLADLPARYRVTARRLRRIEQIERAAIIQALAEGNGNKSRAAELLEIGRATLYRKMTAYGLDLELTTA